MAVSTGESRPDGMFRSCFRCGEEFRRNGGSRICSKCRVSVRGTKPLNPKLSFREKQVVDLVSQSKLNKEIAHELHLSEGTIKEYLHRIFRKLGIKNRTQLAVFALTQMTEQQRNKHVA